MSNMANTSRSTSPSRPAHPASSLPPRYTPPPPGVPPIWIPPTAAATPPRARTRTQPTSPPASGTPPSKRERERIHGAATPTPKRTSAGADTPPPPGLSPMHKGVSFSLLEALALPMSPLDSDVEARVLTDESGFETPTAGASLYTPPRVPGVGRSPRVLRTTQGFGSPTPSRYTQPADESYRTPPTRPSGTPPRPTSTFASPASVRPTSPTPRVKPAPHHVLHALAALVPGGALAVMQFLDVGEVVRVHERHVRDGERRERFEEVCNSEKEGGGGVGMGMGMGEGGGEREYRGGEGVFGRSLRRVCVYAGVRALVGGRRFYDDGGDNDEGDTMMVREAMGEKEEKEKEDLGMEGRKGKARTLILPIVVFSTVEQLFQSGLYDPGLFRDLPDPRRLRELVQAFDRAEVPHHIIVTPRPSARPRGLATRFGGNVSLHLEGTPEIAGVLSTFLHSLPHPICALDGTNSNSGWVDAVWAWCVQPRGPRSSLGDFSRVPGVREAEEERRVEVARVMGWGCWGGWGGGGGEYVWEGGVWGAGGVMFWARMGRGRGGGEEEGTRRAGEMMVWFLRRWGAISEGLFELGEQLERGEWSALGRSNAVRKWGEGGSAGSGIGSGKVGSGVLSGIGPGNASENWIGSGSGDASGGMVSSVSSYTYSKDASAQVGYRPSASFTEGLGVQGGFRGVAKGGEDGKERVGEMKLPATKSRSPLPGNVAMPVPVPAVQEPSRRRAGSKGRVKAKDFEGGAGFAGTDRAFSDIKLPAKSQTELTTPPTFSSMYGETPVSSVSPPDRPLTPAVFSSTYTHAKGSKSGKGPSVSSYAYPKDGSAQVGYQPSVMPVAKAKIQSPLAGNVAMPVPDVVPPRRRRAHSKSTVRTKELERDAGFAGTDKYISDVKPQGSPKAQLNTPPTFSSVYTDTPNPSASPPGSPSAGEVVMSPKEFTQAYAGGEGVGVDRESPVLCTMRDGKDARDLESVDAMLEDMLRGNEGAGEANVRGRKRRSTVTQKPAGGVKERNGVVVQPLLVKSRRGTLAAQDDVDVRAPGASMIGGDARRVVASPKVVDDRDVVNEDDSDDGRSMRSVNSSFHLYDRLNDVGAVSPDLREIVERIMARAPSPVEK
ncbi:hypothetical protein DFP72DRAFT_1152680 [Ephemerocybe angulata]|uniref:Uncharacterized protein n=1 Tax=Ephemerocybe angulata TaxID=980116 RepID=A0A8H6LWC3_9AGAR|nr:hypothetical protein DFP72DRAFT_1152680 [Tulosesus angulatus]